MDSRPAFGFVVVRCITSPESDAYWRECYRCIRKWHDDPILIVDDSVRPELITEIPMTNCTVVSGSAPRRGELLGWYEFYKRRPFEMALIIHDSVFLQEAVDWKGWGPCAFLWSCPHWYDHETPAAADLQRLQNADEVLDLYHHPELWNGCFGTMAVVTWDFLAAMDARYDAFDRLLSLIVDRDHRCGLERAMACLCTRQLMTMTGGRPGVIFGDIYNHGWGRTYTDYVDYHIIGGHPSLYPVLKCWASR